MENTETGGELGAFLLLFRKNSHLTVLQRRAYEATGIRVKVYLLEDRFHLRIRKRIEPQPVKQAA